MNEEQQISQEARKQLYHVSLDTTRGDPGNIGVKGGDLADQ